MFGIPNFLTSDYLTFPPSKQSSAYTVKKRSRQLILLKQRTVLILTLISPLKLITFKTDNCIDSYSHITTKTGILIKQVVRLVLRKNRPNCLASTKDRATSKVAFASCVYPLVPCDMTFTVKIGVKSEAPHPEQRIFTGIKTEENP